MRKIGATVLLSLAMPSMAASAPVVEHWTATSSTAMAITGDIDLSPTRIVMADKSLPLAVAGDVKAFATALNGPQPARVLRVTKPADPVLLHGNTLCGAPVRWIVVYRSDAGRSLNMAAFSSAAQPTGERGEGLCGTFLYSR